ncbi:MAG TPA: methyltransferase domain-containing protein [Candidatus Dormibacteraeota bacterium]|nr:methyltransferase domain-containing protein [Candidatus Dormibacteraeota bacterium]
MSDVDRRAAVRDAYSAAARDPHGEHPFTIGRALALGVGYPAQMLDRVPDAAVAAFAGVAAVSVHAELRPSDRVLDLGCGAGLDALTAAARLRQRGEVVGIDFSADMLRCAQRARGADDAGRLVLCCASAEALPLQDGSVDVALVNGVFNLNPARHAIFDELARVVRPGGRVYAAELILQVPLPPSEMTAASWFA